MRRAANYFVPLLAAFTFIVVRTLLPSSNSWIGDSPARILLGAICAALMTYAVCAAIDWIAKPRQSRSEE